MRFGDDGSAGVDHYRVILQNHLANSLVVLEVSKGLLILAEPLPHVVAKRGHSRQGALAVREEGRLLLQQLRFVFNKLVGPVLFGNCAMSAALSAAASD